MAKIQYTNKTTGATDASGKWQAADANEVKASVNSLYDNPLAAPNGLPAGGTAGQVLSKVNSTNYNTQWVTPASGGVQTLTVRLTSAQILALNGTPVTLVAAQGADTFIQPLRFFAKAATGATPYTGGTSAIIKVATLQTAALSGAFGQATGAITIYATGATAGTSDFTSILNQPLQISLSAAATGGDQAYDITVSYLVVAIPA